MDQDFRALIGRRARTLRLQSGRSLREQARRAEVAPSALSQLENGRGGLSLDGLQRLAADFELHVTDLLAEEHASEAAGDPAVEITRNCIAAIPAVHRGHGALFQQIGGPGHQLQPYIISLAPGAGWRAVWEVKPGEEWLYVLAGEIELLVNDDVHRLRQGDAARFRTEHPHGFRNPSDHGPATIIGASTPPW
jgi:transcriptional regulator with XRE-family HTH domain